MERFTRIIFKNYKALKNYSIVLNSFNILVGPNNAGKSTIISAFKILSEGMKRARTRKASYISDPSIKDYGHLVKIDEIPVASENIFTDYDDSEPANITFVLSNKNTLELIFPENDLCYLICRGDDKTIITPKDFKKEFNCEVAFVPVLGPLEHNEKLFQKETARIATLNHRASRNFRNIWHHFPERFSDFRIMVQETWPGMDIEFPEVDSTYEPPVLHMFCPENRITREIYWAGFGFQVWCQMLTFLVQAESKSILLIDEPDIYLHSDLQRKLVGILRDLGCDIVIATHSTEMISEADPNDIVVINKNYRSGRRIKNVAQLQSIFESLGSILNPTLTQLAKTRKAIFIEGKDFKILSQIAKRLNYHSIAGKSEFAIVPVEGFNPERVKNFSKAMELTIGMTIMSLVILDRDYRCDGQIEEIRQSLLKFTRYVHIHKQKEIENYLLIPIVLQKAIKRKIEKFDERIDSILNRIIDNYKTKVIVQYQSNFEEYYKKNKPELDNTTIKEKALLFVEEKWNTLQGKISVCPGKQVLADLNSYLNEEYKVSLTISNIISAITYNEIPNDLLQAFEMMNELIQWKNT